jgi:hypothetical protein
MTFDLLKIVKNFQLDGSCVDAAPYGSGHINDTFRVRLSRDKVTTSYILQHINVHVFKEPILLMENIVRVTQHVQRRLEAEADDNVKQHALTVIPTVDGMHYYLDEDGLYWRVYNFVDGPTYDAAELPAQTFEAAKAFGRFQTLLADLPAPPLQETIPHFHDGPRRYATFSRTVLEDVVNRACQAKKEIDFLNSHASLFDILPREVEAGRIPMRVTHNDTKINNIIFDPHSGESKCVIDLDTVMPGLVLYDFGDMVRSGISPAAEDERDLAKVTLDLSRFQAITEGYLSTAADFLCAAECSHLVTGARLLPLMIGTRFLTDFLQGDTYFKTQRPNHNLDRCRVQFKIYEQLTRRTDALDNMVEACLTGARIQN